MPAESPSKLATGPAHGRWASSWALATTAKRTGTTDRQPLGKALDCCAALVMSSPARQEAQAGVGSSLDPRETKESARSFRCPVDEVLSRARLDQRPVLGAVAAPGALVATDHRTIRPRRAGCCLRNPLSSDGAVYPASIDPVVAYSQRIAPPWIARVFGSCTKAATPSLRPGVDSPIGSSTDPVPLPPAAAPSAKAF